MQPRFNTIENLEARQLFASLTPGITTTTTISTIGTTKNWTIPLVAGRAVTIAAGDLGTGTFAPQISLINPAGQTVSTSSGNAGAFITTTATVTGTYRVKLNDVGNNQTGSTRITAFYYASSIADSDDAYSAESGRRYAAGISPGDLDVWKITASNKQFLSVLSSENKPGSAMGIGLQLIGPDGKFIAQKTNDKGTKIDLPTSSVAGNYYAVVYEPGANDTGRYGISFARAPGSQTPEDPDTNHALPAGEKRTGDLPSGDTDVYGVSLSAGKTINATFAAISGSGVNPELLVIDPTGKVVKTANATSSVSISYKATVAGTYYLVLRDREADTGGKYTIKYTLS